MAFDETGQADTEARKVAICERAYKLLTETVPAEDIIFDREDVGVEDDVLRLGPSAISNL